MIIRKLIDKHVPYSYGGSIKDVILYYTDYNHGFRKTVHKIVKLLFGDYGE